MRLEGATRAAIIAALLVGCSSFRANDAPSDPSMNDGGLDAGTDSQDGSSSSVGQQAVAPTAPLAVTAKAVTVVTTVTTLAGSGTAAFADGTGAAASFNSPHDVLVNNSTGDVYVADTVNNRIRKVTKAGVVTTLAGSGAVAYADGSGVAASFSSPSALAFNPAGDLIVSDANNNRIRKVTTAGVVTTLAGSGTMDSVDGSGTAASFNGPVAVAVNSAGVAYVGEASGNRIRQVTPAGVVTNLAGSNAGAFGDGTGSAASFFHPWSVALDSGGTLYVADLSNNRIRAVTPTGVVTTFAGSGNPDLVDGVGVAASFLQPSGVAVDTRGNVFVSDGGTRIRRITPGGAVTTLAGSDGSAFSDGVDGAASFNGPEGLAVDAAGVVYVADSANHRIRKLTIVGIGQLAVTWNGPTSAASAITGYTASATASGQPTRSCAATGATSCTIDGLTSGVRYDVSVTATNSAGTSSPSAVATGTPN
jgi:sugar lactone lactonase YvrE